MFGVVSRYLGRGVDNASLAVFRVAFGLLMLHHVYVEYADYGGFRHWFVEPGFHYTYYGFGWVRPLPDWVQQGLFAAQALSCAGIALGFAYRACAVVNFLATCYFFLLEKTLYLNHGYLLCLVSFLAILMPLHARWSLDARGWPRVAASHSPGWVLDLLRLQIGVAYFYGGLAKLNADWLRGEPMRSYLAGWEGRPYVGLLAHNEPAVYFFSYGGLLLDLLVVPALLYRRTRMVAFLAATGFHLANSQLFHIAIFPWFMIAATTLYFEPNWPTAILRRARGLSPSSEPAIIAAPAIQPWLAIFIVGWVAVQLIVPFRHFLYPGNASWTEEGHNFAWRMMLRHKDIEPRFVWYRLLNRETGEISYMDVREVIPERDARELYRQPSLMEQMAHIVARGKGDVEIQAEVRLIQFTVTDKANGMSWGANMPDYSKDWQTEIACQDPDLILQLAHEIARKERAKGRDVEVRAEVWISLHGRPHQLLVDPKVDLAAQPRSLWPKSWIMPLNTASD